MLVARSITAMALFSWQVTQALVLSAEIVMYSGSMSCATLALGPKMRTPAAFSVAACALKAEKSAVDTLLCVRLATPPLISMIDTEPSGSIV
ncbi:hypothetical protein D3C87_1625170 [compost metagenome]